MRALSQADRDRFYAEAAPAARLYGAIGAPVSEAILAQQRQAMRPKLEQSQIVFDFLDIMRRTPAAPGPLRPLQHLMIRAGVEILPEWTRDILGLGPSYGLRLWERRLVAFAGDAADRVVLKFAPPAQACLRMGQPASYLYWRGSRPSTHAVTDRWTPI